MKNKEILRNERFMIATFLGMHIKKKWLGYGLYTIRNKEIAWTFTKKQAKNVICGLRFDSRWGLLIPVIENIKNIGTDSETSEKEYTLLDNIDNSLVVLRIDLVYQTVVKFINWYNKNK